MVGISSLDNGLTSGVLDTSQAIQKKQVNDEELIRSKSQSGDTVTISAEAMALLRSKLEEYGAEDPSELNDEQKEDLKGTMDEFAKKHGLDPTKVGGMPPPPGENGQDGPPQGKSEGPPPEGGKGAGGAKGGEAAGGSTETSDEVTDKENEIKEKEEEIEELRLKAGRDEDAAELLKMKQSELALLQNELTLLEQQSA
ncbi:MAG: hypothetical protein BA863_05765 [Desulfovibrio sp. S3730MH75]|nr:MAG: hypothetical protein BA863_05765 [Desulfovibrio sp. S3730MH75]